MRQLPLGIRLRDASVFSSFHPGPNREVYARLRELQPAGPAPVLWIHGPAGSGKTHLLQAVCASWGTAGRRAFYVPLAQLGSERPDLLMSAELLDVVCVDDVDAVAGDSGWERALFRLFTASQESATRLVFAALAPPASIGLNLPDLASRLASGLVLALRPLGEQDTISALRLRAAERGLELPEETVQYLMRRLPRDLASLCAFLDELDEAALVAQRRLTVPFARQVLSSGDESAQEDGE